MPSGRGHGAASHHSYPRPSNTTFFFFFVAQVSLSDAHQVVLKAVRLNMAGKYRCEVSADQPNFHTEMVAGELHVVCKSFFRSA